MMYFEPGFAQSGDRRLENIFPHHAGFHEFLMVRPCWAARLLKDKINFKL